MLKHIKIVHTCELFVPCDRYSNSQNQFSPEKHRFFMISNLLSLYYHFYVCILLKCVCVENSQLLFCIQKNIKNT
jgi:hypothetical protein